MSRIATRLGMSVVLLLATGQAIAQKDGEQLYRSDHALVRYAGIEPSQAEAIARVVDASRKVAVDSYHFNLPQTISVTVDCGPGNKVRLFNDGQDRLSLSIRSPEQLKPPSESGIFHLYGLCHEVGHLAMYRVIQDHHWLSHAGAEGWAHFLGSQMVDGVYDALGESGWCYPYDYRQDGTARLDAQLSEPNPNKVSQAAGLWRELAGLIGSERIAPLFEAWGEAEVDPADPGAALRRALLEIKEDEQVALRTEPIEAPTRFMICVGFNPTGTKGVYVFHDAAAGDTEIGREGQSRVGLPGRMGNPMSEGDWLIRAVIDQHEDADALRE